MAERKRELKSLVVMVKEESERVWHDLETEQQQL